MARPGSSRLVQRNQNALVLPRPKKNAPPGGHRPSFLPNELLHRSDFPPILELKKAVKVVMNNEDLVLEALRAIPSKRDSYMVHRISKWLRNISMFEGAWRGG
jgi:hypothetical protein